MANNEHPHFGLDPWGLDPWVMSKSVEDYDLRISAIYTSPGQKLRFLKGLEVERQQ